MVLKKLIAFFVNAGKGQKVDMGPFEVMHDRNKKLVCILLQYLGATLQYLDGTVHVKKLTPKVTPIE